MISPLPSQLSSNISDGFTATNTNKTAYLSKSLYMRGLKCRKSLPGPERTPGRRWRRLPALVPEMTYEGMEISGGEMASEAYFRMGEISDSAVLAKLRKDLLDYCRQYTLGFVRLVEKLRAMEGNCRKGT